jgi:hypothetical protein
VAIAARAAEGRCRRGPPGPRPGAQQPAAEGHAETQRREEPAERDPTERPPLQSGGAELELVGDADQVQHQTGLGDELQRGQRAHRQHPVQDVRADQPQDRRRDQQAHRDLADHPVLAEPPGHRAAGHGEGEHHSGRRDDLTGPR